MVPEEESVAGALPELVEDDVTVVLGEPEDEVEVAVAVESEVDVESEDKDDDQPLLEPLLAAVAVGERSLPWAERRLSHCSRQMMTRRSSAGLLQTTRKRSNPRPYRKSLGLHPPSWGARSGPDPNWTRHRGHGSRFPISHCIQLPETQLPTGCFA